MRPRGTGLPLANYPLEIADGQYGTGNRAQRKRAPGRTAEDLQAKYDGSKTLGRHIFRYGFDFNRIAAGASPF